MTATRAGRRRLDPDELVALEEERDFLLRSLEDLEAEHDAGDIDEADYEALKDDYTARAATALRAIDDRRARFAAAREPRSRWRLVAVVGGLLAVAVLAGFLLARSSGVRTEGDTATGGDIGLTTRDQLARAATLASQGEALEAIQIYDDVLEADPENVEALTYRGWVLVLAGLYDEAQPYFDAAVELEPDYPDVRAFRAVSLARQGRNEEALAEIEAFEATNPPAGMTGLIDGLRSQIEAGTADGAATGATAPGSTTTTAGG